MSRKSFLLAVGIALLLVGGSAAALFLLIRHEPEVYRRAAVPPGEERQRQNKEFQKELTEHLWPALRPGSEEPFDLRLTDEQINSYFAEDFKHHGLEERLLPEGISEPRVVFEPGQVHFAFRYGSGLWSSVITVDFQVWLTRQTNVVAMKLVGLQAGSLPIGAQTLLDNLSEVVESNGIQIDWYRHEGHPVALLRFQSDQRETTMQIQDLQIQQGSIVIRGKPVEQGTTRAAALPADRPAAGN